MSEKEWVLLEVKELAEKAQSYEKKAFFQELEEIILEQYKRIDQAKSELDGNLWSPKKW
ncbi:MAG: hypothetical protein RR554_02645 [Vagococcus sp.]|uniref:hypothetical protein n=1 Tax=Vagococcus sp. TaxID=1933889 RepID=UPI002FC68D8D